MTKRGWIVGACALLTAGAAQAEELDKTYANVGDWEISYRISSGRCIMQRFYSNKASNKIESLTVLYAPDKGAVSLTWTNDWMTDLPVVGDLDLGVAFKKGALIDRSWGSHKMHYDKIGKMYLFSFFIVDPVKAPRMLRDLAENDNFGLFRGPALITGLPLDASGAVESLRECSLNGGVR
jgi:hypothetical protein